MSLRVRANGCGPGMREVFMNLRTVDIAILLVKNIAMKIANIADLKNRLSEYLSLVEKGEEIEIRKRNVPVARVVPLRRRTSGQPLGAGAGTVRIRGKLTEPLIPSNVWDSSRGRR